jgi:hypothetical protein
MDRSPNIHDRLYINSYLSFYLRRCRSSITAERTGNQKFQPSALCFVNGVRHLRDKAPSGALVEEGGRVNFCDWD